LIPWLTDNTAFPLVEHALISPNGLLAAGGDLSVPRLLEAYRSGIFPWFNPGEPILWWSPNPRMVLIPGEFKTSRSLAKILRNSVYEVRCNTVFEQVMRGCAAPRAGHIGTWINEDMIAAYCALHQRGYAHSVEVWMPKQFHIEGEARRQRSNNMNSTLSAAISERGSQRSISDGLELELELVGGLYGVSIGRMFYGESMFSDVSNASKIALAHLAKQLERWQFGMIDCQMNTPHLATLGAREIPRSEFIVSLKELIHCAPIDKKQLFGQPSDWQFETDLFT
jgi:leucyl/phenylalanyl-tRNA--protein transferase